MIEDHGDRVEEVTPVSTILPASPARGAGDLHALVLTTVVLTANALAIGLVFAVGVPISGQEARVLFADGAIMGVVGCVYVGIYRGVRRRVRGGAD